MNVHIIIDNEEKIIRVFKSSLDAYDTYRDMCGDYHRYRIESHELIESR